MFTFVQGQQLPTLVSKLQREKEMCGTKGQESQPSVQDELGGAKTHDDGIRLVQVYGRTAQGASTHINVMCKNLNMGTVMGKNQACFMSTVACFFRRKAIAANCVQSRTSQRVDFSRFTFVPT